MALVERKSVVGYGPEAPLPRSDWFHFFKKKFHQLSLLSLLNQRQGAKRADEQRPSSINFSFINLISPLAACLHAELCCAPNPLNEGEDQREGKKSKYHSIKLSDYCCDTNYHSLLAQLSMKLWEYSKIVWKEILMKVFGQSMNFIYMNEIVFILFSL